MDINKETLNFFEQIYANGATTTKQTKITLKPAIKEKEFELALPVDKLFELYGNLVLAGFSQDEALIIVIGVIVHGKSE
jgi:hypothetical protein